MPAPVVPRLITVTYGGFSVGGTTNYQLHGFHDADGELGQRTIELDVVVRDTTVAGCKTLADALEAAFRKRDQDLTVVIDGTTWLQVTHDGNTGFNARATWALTGFARTKKSRTYRITVTVLLPADDLEEKNGRQSSSWTLATNDVGQRTITLRATYTALPDAGDGALSATEVIAEHFDDWATEIKDLVDDAAEWEPGGRDVEPDDNDKVATVTEVWHEITFDQAAGVRNDPALVKPQYEILTFRTAVPQLAGSGAAEPISVTIAFSTGFHLVEVEPNEIRQAVEDKVVAYLAGLLAIGTDAPAPIAVEKNVKVDPTNNRASGVVTYAAFASSLIRCSLRVQDYEYAGNVLVPVMDRNPHSRDLHPSPGLRRRVITYAALELGDGTGENALGPLRAAREQAVAEGFWLQDEQEEGESFERRIAGGDQGVLMFERAVVVTYEYGEIAGGGSLGPTRTRR